MSEEYKSKNLGLGSFRPASRAQYLMLISPAKFMLAGGSLGALKTASVVIDGAMDRDNPRSRYAIFRRTFPELDRSVIQEAYKWYPQMGGVYNTTRHVWTFPSGATVAFHACEREVDVHKFQGSEFSGLAFDEATHFSIKQIRYLMSRLRTTDPALQKRARVRLATNPGGNCHKELRDIFIGPVCTCERCHNWIEGKSLTPLKIYTDRRWPEENTPIGMSTCFIPSKLSDHKLLGEDYKLQLKGLPRSFAEALLVGCWAAWEGQYFTNWNMDTMVVPRASIQPQPYWYSWVATDYGFGDSHAVSHLFARGTPTDEFPRGRVYVLESTVAKGMKAVDYALALRARWADRQHISGWPIDPSVFGNRGGEGVSIGVQMQEAARIGFEPAPQDRAAGSQMILGMLDSGELVVSNSCQEVIECIPTRVHDEDNPLAVRKIRKQLEDDVYDALYMGVLWGCGRVVRLSDEQRIAAAMTAADPNARAMQHMRAAEEIAAERRPIGWVRSRRLTRRRSGHRAGGFGGF